MNSLVVFCIQLIIFLFTKHIFCVLMEYFDSKFDKNEISSSLDKACVFVSVLIVIFWAMSNVK